MNMKLLHMVAFTLVVVGALNWGLVALLDFNLVKVVFGALDPLVEKLVYVLVAASAVVLVVQHKVDCKTCGG